MKRGGAIRRTKPLRPGSRKLGRSRLNPIGARAKRAAPDLKAFREALLSRAGKVCERCSCPSRDPLEGHHLVNRARAAGWPGLHDPVLNGALVCRSCHFSLTVDPRDVGGPLEREAGMAFRAFEAWRAGSK
jgi:hypothetical protein